MKIEINGVCFRYNKKKPLLEDVNACFESGRCYVVKGPNGCGKTTLSKLILGLLAPQKGSITLDGADIRHMSVAEISQKIGYLFQNAELQLFAPTAREELSFPFEINGTLDGQAKRRIADEMSRFGIAHLADSFPLSLSGGEKQRLALATIFVRDIGFLILDEPTSSIDSAGKEYLAGLVSGFQKNGGGVIIISHDEEFCGMLPAPAVIEMGGGDEN